MHILRVVQNHNLQSQTLIFLWSSIIVNSRFFKLCLNFSFCCYKTKIFGHKKIAFLEKKNISKHFFKAKIIFLIAKILE